MDVPVVAAAGLKGDVEDPRLLRGEGGEEAPAGKIPGVGSVGLPDGEHHGPGVPGHGVVGLPSSAQTSFAMRKAAQALGQPA